MTESGKHLREINMIMILDNRLKKTASLEAWEAVEDNFSYPVQNYKKLNQGKSKEVE